MIPDSGTVLLRLAEGVPRNRDQLGLHYPSDHPAGKMLDANTIDILRSCPNFTRLLNAACSE